MLFGFIRKQTRRINFVYNKYMTNVYNQKRLDKIKWEESEKQLRDMSGEMEWCEVCKYRRGVECDCTQYEREKDTLCATAYNRMKRGVNKK